MSKHDSRHTSRIPRPPSNHTQAAINPTKDMSKQSKTSAPKSQVSKIVESLKRGEYTTTPREFTGSEASLSLSLKADDCEYKVINEHPECILSGLDVLWRQGRLCDATIVVGQRRLSAHKVVLASCADHFYDAIVNVPVDQQQQQRCHPELFVEGVQPAIMESLLECMYTGNITISAENVRDLLGAASFIKFWAVEQACGDYLKDRLNPDNSLRMLNIAFSFDIRDLREVALKIAARNFMVVSEGFDFQQLTIDQLMALLQRDDIQGASELEVFRRAVSWIEHDRKSRTPHAASILSEIRLPLLSPSDVVDHVENVDYLMEIPDCQRLVKEALHYHCLPARQSILQSTRTCPRSCRKRDVILATGGAPRMKNDPVCDDISYYDPHSDTWGLLTRMKEPRHHHAVAVLGGFLYVAGGEETNDQRSPLSSAYRYDPRTGQWLQIASMLRCRESFQLGVLNGHLYAVGGRVDKDQSLAEVERYNPAVDAWEGMAPISTPRRSVAIAVLNGRLYAVGGSGQKRISSKVERYNPLTDQWEMRRQMTSPRFFSMLAAVRNRLYLSGGATLDPSGNVVCMTSVECYTPATDTWVSVAQMLEPRAEAGYAVLNNRIFVVGGYSWDRNLRLDSAELYDADRDAWIELAPLRTAFTGIAACAITLYNVPEDAPSSGPTEPDDLAEDDVSNDNDDTVSMATATQSVARKVHSLS